MSQARGLRADGDVTVARTRNDEGSVGPGIVHRILERTLVHGVEQRVADDGLCSLADVDDAGVMRNGVPDRRDREV